MAINQDNVGESNVNISKPAKRLWTECNPIDQPEGTYRFCLNGVNGTLDGSENMISNEHSNSFIQNFDTIIGECYLGSNSNLIFSINNGISEIGIFKADIYTILISDNTSLNFSIRNQIQATLRVINNKRVVSYVDGLNDAKIVNVDAMYLHYTVAYQNWLNNGSIGLAPTQWNIESFNLITTYNSIPEFTSATILNYGSILAGSYSFAIRLLDTSLNSTNFISTSNPINIYNDRTDNTFENIHGSRNISNDAQSYQRAAKSIQLTIDNLDTNFLFYQIAIIQSSSNTGTILNCLLSDPIDINQRTYTYTGNDSELGSITVDEILINRLNIKKPNTIEQLENRLLLGNGQDVNYPWCSFQQYASQIKTDVAKYDYILNTEIDNANTKNPTSSFVLKGFMPGEAYCLGVVYVMTDLTESPVFHIPGPVSGDSTTSMQTYELESGYSDIHNCDATPYWGNDYQGNPLLGNKVRINRLPFRSQVSLSDYVLVNPIIGTENININNYSVNISLIGSYPTLSGQPQVFTFTVRYKVLGIPSVFTATLQLTQSLIGTNIIFYTDNGNQSLDTDFTPTINGLDLTIFSAAFPSAILVSSKSIINPVESTLMGIKFSNIVQPSGTIGFYIVRTDRLDEDKLVIDNGIIGPNTSLNGYNAFSKFYPQIYPILADIPGGFYPYTQSAIFDTQTAWLYYPQHQFLGDKREAQTLRIEGEYQPASAVYPYSPENMPDNFFNGIAPNPVPAPSTLESIVVWNKFGVYTYNVQAGSSYTTTGINFNVWNSYKITDFDFVNGGVLGTLGTEINLQSSFYLNAADYTTINGLTPINSSTDNKMCIIQPVSTTILNTILNSGSPNYTVNDYSSSLNLGLSAYPNPNYFYLKYVSLLSNVSNAYSDFLTRTYYKEHNNMILFADVYASVSNTISLFSGDTTINHYDMVSTNYIDYLPHSINDNDTWKIVAGVLLTVAAIAITVSTFGAAAGTIPIAITTITALAISQGISLLQSGITGDILRKMIVKDYAAGLYQCITDIEVTKFQNAGGSIYDYPLVITGSGTPDIYRWFSDIVHGVYIESSLNVPLRTKLTATGTDFLDLPQGIQSHSLATINYPFSTIESYIREKLTVLDIDTGSGRLYRGYPMSEFNDINLDYQRRNREKNFYQLPLNYDCCSQTVNQFPNRIWYSEQSFQEQSVDNCRIFLPNNYRDIESEHGEITNIFRKSDQLYVHTTEALWFLPKNLQERVTDQITSFIGTGDFFSVPPKLIVDDDLGTAGSQDKWATVKTKKGIFFANQMESKVYWLSENGLQVISIIGNETWFKSNLPSKLNNQYSNIFGQDLTIIGNPTNPNGIGLHATYDNYYNRILLTKKDYLIANGGTFVSAIGDATLYNIYFNPSTGIFYHSNGFDFVPIDLDNSIYFENHSFTISFSIDDLAWISLHSYLPNFYIRNQNDFYASLSKSLTNIGYGLYKHNDINSFQVYFGVYYPHILEYISVSNPLTVRNWNTILLNTEARVYDPTTNQFIPRQDYTFTAAIFYNTTQSTGLQQLVNKDSKASQQYYLSQQIVNLANQIIIAKREKYWHINDIRDYVTTKNAVLFNADWGSISSLYYIDKVPNSSIISSTKNWYELEIFRDRYMAIRLYLYDSILTDVNLTTQYSIEEETTSTR